MESISTNGRVLITDETVDVCIVIQRTCTNGRVIIAACVAIERVETNCCIVQASGETKERIFTFSGVRVRISSIRWRINGPSQRRKRKAGERERNENERTPDVRAVH